jgi:hypothetical protein
MRQGSIGSNSKMIRATSSAPPLIGDYDKVYAQIVQADGITMVLRFGDPSNQALRGGAA